MSEPTLRKVLFVAYHFHPDLEIGAMRSVKFAKYLPQFGWQAHVVSVTPRHYERVDPASLPFPCSVYRADKWPTVFTLGNWLIRKLRAPAAQAPGTGGAAASTLNTPPVVTSLPTTFWKRFLTLVAMTPDIHVGWLIPAAWLAIKVARRENVDIIYTSGPPHTGHLAGLIASWVTGRPLVCDFRDPWTTGPPPEPGLVRFFARIDRLLERMVLRRSRLVLAATPGVRDGMVEAHRPMLDTKCVALINGFDVEDFPTPAESTPSAAAGPISFVYAGSLYGDRDPRPFLTALGEMIREALLPRDSICVDFYGPVAIEAEPIRQVMDAHALHGLVNFRESVKRQEYLSIVSCADVLLIIQADDTPWALPAKNFEYLATGNEILLLSGPYALAQFLQGYENVHRADPHDTSAIRACITRIVGRIHSGARDRSRNLRSLTHMHKKELTGELARLFDQVVSTR